MCDPLFDLTAIFATTINPETMTPADIDRLHDAINQVIANRSENADLNALYDLFKQLNHILQTQQTNKPTSEVTR